MENEPRQTQSTQLDPPTSWLNTSCPDTAREALTLNLKRVDPDPRVLRVHCSASSPNNPVARREHRVYPGEHVSRRLKDRPGIRHRGQCRDFAFLSARDRRPTIMQPLQAIMAVG